VCDVSVMLTRMNPKCNVLDKVPRLSAIFYAGAVRVLLYLTFFKFIFRKSHFLFIDMILPLSLYPIKPLQYT
jgi:hypothetical protein